MNGAGCFRVFKCASDMEVRGTMRRVHIPWVQGLIRASVFGVLGFRAFGCEGLGFWGVWIPKFKMLEAYG